MKWVEGRQGTGYETCLLFQSERFKFDCYLIRYRPGSYVGSHVDPVPSGEHHRLNIILQHAKRGGEFHALKWLYKSDRIKYFRSDSPHWVDRIDEGTRYVFSIGWIRES